MAFNAVLLRRAAPNPRHFVEVEGRSMLRTIEPQRVAKGTRSASSARRGTILVLCLSRTDRSSRGVTANAKDRKKLGRLRDQTAAERSDSVGPNREHPIRNG